jgi:hypothetical protein
MRLIKGSVMGLVLAGMMLAPAAAFAHGAGGGGHGFGGGHFAAGHFGGGHLGGFAGRTSGFHGGAHYRGHNWYGGPYLYGGPYWGAGWWDGGPYWDTSPYYSYYDDNSGAYSQAAPWQPDATSSRDTVIAVQQKLARLGYYHGSVDGIMGPQTRQAIRSFQSVNKLPATGLVDGATLKGLQIS